MAVIGIDLGTTNTVLAQEGKVLPFENGGVSLPSVVAYVPSGEVLVGEPARRRRPIDPLNTIYSSKRLIGRSWHSAATREFKRRYPFELGEGEDGETLITTRHGQRTPIEVAAEILMEAQRRTSVSFAGATGVIAVPTVFREPQRAATVEAGRAAGLYEVRLIDEPAATARAYAAAGHRQGCAAVYDFGGGTFDLALIDNSAQPMRVLAHGGDLYLGGDDVDRALAEWAAAAVLERDRWDIGGGKAALVAACEAAKIELVRGGTASLDLRAIDPAAPASVAHLDLPATVLDEVAGKLARRSFLLCDEVLMQAKMKAREVEAVFLAGGATHLPAVRAAVAAYFGKEPRSDLDPMHAVAIGASIA